MSNLIPVKKELSYEGFRGLLANINIQKCIMKSKEHIRDSLKLWRGKNTSVK